MRSLAGRSILLLPLLACAVASCTRVTPSPPIVRVFATDSGFVTPARFPGGIVEVHLINQGSITHEGVFTRFLTPGANGAAYADSVRAGVEVPAFSEDVGGPGLALPGDSTVVWMDLMPGHYAIMCWYKGHVEHGGIHDFDVVPSPVRASPPRTDLSVKMIEYNYVMSGDWSSGSHVVMVENGGSEWHEFDPYRLEPGKTPADFTHWIETGRPGPPPAKALGGSGTFAPGHRVWLPLTLTPGRYFAFCQMPAKGGKEHYQIGMLREFTVK